MIGRGLAGRRRRDGRGGCRTGARGSGRNRAGARGNGRNRAGAQGNGRNRAEALGNGGNHRLAVALVASNLHNYAARACDRSADERGRQWACLVHDAPQSNRLPRPTTVKAPIIGRAGNEKVQWGPAPRSNWCRRVRDHEQAAEDRITVAVASCPKRDATTWIAPGRGESSRDLRMKALLMKALLMKVWALVARRRIIARSSRTTIHMTWR